MLECFFIGEEYISAYSAGCCFIMDPMAFGDATSSDNKLQFRASFMLVHKLLGLYVNAYKSELFILLTT